MIILALSSGTSADSIDVALARFERDDDGILVLAPLGHFDRPWPADLRDRILAALPPAPTSVAEMCALDTLIGQTFGATAAGAMDELGIDDVDLVVSHGQTVFHWVEASRALGTLQLGQAAFIAERVGAPVLSDVRVADVAAGGHGAPLAAIFDSLWLATEPGVRRAALNLGGIANVTVVSGSDQPVLAFDTGPANCLLDVAVAAIGPDPYDRDGALARSGSVDVAALERLLDEPYYRLDPPKSTGRELFHSEYVAARVGASLSGPDLLATLTELTARTVSDALRPFDVSEVVASGGGTKNSYLMSRLKACLSGVNIVRSDEVGLASDAKEAYLFALLGWLSWHGFPGTAGGGGGLRATGASGPRVLGTLTPGPGGAWPPPRDPTITAPTRLRIRSASRDHEDFGRT